MADEFDEIDDGDACIAPIWADIWLNPVARMFACTSIMMQIIRELDPEVVMG